MSQGTIKTYDETTKRGVLLDDAKNEYAFDIDSFKDSGTRLFRLGQRVKFQLVGEQGSERVRDLRLITL